MASSHRSVTLDIAIFEVLSDLREASDLFSHAEYISVRNLIGTTATGWRDGLSPSP